MDESFCNVIMNFLQVLYGRSQVEISARGPDQVGCQVTQKIGIWNQEKTGTVTIPIVEIPTNIRNFMQINYYNQ